MTPDTLAPAESPARQASSAVTVPKRDWLVPADIELRVLQGPQAGSRLAIAAGQTYSLGSADECSVVLVGQDVLPEHAEVQVLGDMVRIRPVGGSVWIDGSELSREGEPWELGSVFLIGRVALCIDEVGMPWPSEEIIAASTALALQGAAAAGELDDEIDDDGAEPATSDGGPDDDPDSGFEGDALPDDAASASAARTTDAPAPPAAPAVGLHKVLNGSSHRSVHLLLAGSGAALVGAIAAAGWVGWTADEAPRARPPGIRTASESVAAPSAQAIETSMAPAANPAAVAKLAPERIAEKLDALARELNEPGRVSLRWTPGPQGPEIRVATTDPARSSAMLARVEAVRAEIGPASITLVEPADMAARFREALQASPLHRKFMADPADPDQLTYKASLSLGDVPAWERLFLTFTQTHGDVPAITVRVSTELDRLGSQIGSVVGGAFPYIVTPEGQRIAPGGSLMGRPVASVQIGEIVFADGVRYRFTP